MKWGQNGKSLSEVGSMINENDYWNPLWHRIGKELVGLRQSLQIDMLKIKHQINNHDRNTGHWIISLKEEIKFLLNFKKC